MELKFRCLMRNVDDCAAGERIVIEILEIIERKFMRLITIDILDIRSSSFDRETHSPWVYVFGQIQVNGILGRAIGRRMISRGTYKLKSNELSEHFEDVYIHFYEDIKRMFRSYY
ncbi:MAG: gamma protein [Huanggang Rhabd tick virus 2]|uniref:Gamma protein n=1 Tax=Huanggang Rhabd tick virus 2 TaxID=2972329 RepID=A0A9E7V2E0_9RHAB|nr:MAG: gamma protein [Huanggang Rhabd tick virus 2]